MARSAVLTPRVIITLQTSPSGNGGRDIGATVKEEIGIN
jgi:hypothetical protein